VEAEGGVGQGVRLISDHLSDGDAARIRDRTGQGGPGLARALPSGADSPVLFFTERSGVKKSMTRPDRSLPRS